MSMQDVLDDVAAERASQDAQYGQQDHPDGTEPAYVFNREAVRQLTEERFAAGVGTWRDILHEEAAEVYAETDPAALRTELVQVAAVAVAWIEAIDRRTAAPAPTE